ncbi:hypothetical protein [Arthrobacter sp. VKM Ac-2550]|uniref:hypothetical protein n=1 Tax=Crystallibacter permensis TaxID=1938888 RepID=UPI0022273D81|nr:hypothetical protein [Arthrobacter sp. VKM Ac-2550]MCW2132710.1 hypothetical protein [Arthrobacter sp. VKM Ac-2550]
MMLEGSGEHLGAVLREARVVGIDRVWVVPGSSTGLAEEPVEVHLLVQSRSARTVGERARQLLRSALERILPGASIRVDTVEDLDGMGDAAHRQALLTMVELTDRLTDREEGRWRVCTASGTLYVFDLTHGNRTMTRLPGHEVPYGDFSRIPADGLRRDGEALRLLSIYRLQLGRPGALLVDVREDGIPTFRATTPVTAITRIEET